MKLMRLFTKPQKPYLVTCLIGIMAIFLAFLSSLLPGVGANIGGGLLLLAGGVAVLVGLTGLAIVTKSLWVKLLIILVVVSGVIWSAMSWQRAEDESNRVYCEEKITNGEQIVEGSEFCDPYR